MQTEKRDPRVNCAGAVVRDDAGRLLLVRRAHEPARGLWSIPGGRIEPGETPERAAAREVREETGLDVEVGALLCRADLGGGYVVEDFAARAVGGTLAAGDDALDAAFFAPDEVRALPLSPGLLAELERMGVL
ncbi:MAG TPA: NUDIX domain-containing protein [Mycobacteriales bacterium]|nr:NUDIX domain-containing protein [Mycobacteriales bacterium]